MRRAVLVLAMIGFQMSGCRVAHAADDAELKAKAQAEIASAVAIMTDLKLDKASISEILELMTIVKLRCEALLEDGKVLLGKIESSGTITPEEHLRLGMFVESSKVCHDANKAAAVFAFNLGK